MVKAKSKIGKRKASTDIGGGDDVSTKRVKSGADQGDNTESGESTGKFSSVLEFCNHIIAEAVSLTDEGEVISGPFLKLPPKKLYADYYTLVASPVSINEVKQYVKKNAANLSLEEFQNMWVQMKDNAEIYNAPDSLIVKDANTICNYVLSEISKYKDQLTSDNENASPNTGEVAAEEAVGNEASESVETKQERDEDDDSVENESVQQDSVDDTSETTSTAKEDIVPDYEDASLEVDDTNEDYTLDLVKVYKHLLSFKISHHKNSIPLAKVFLDLPDRNDPNIEDYYDIVTEPMSFNIVGERLDQGLYSKGSIGYNNFVRDVNLIFDNALDVFGEGPYYKAATGLAKAFEKRLERFNSQVIEKRKQAIVNGTAASNTKTKKKASKTDADEEGEIDTNEDIDMENSEDIDNLEEAEEVKIEIPSIIRKHDVEKAETIEEIDDITAFIKKFVICSTTNLINITNNLKTLLADNAPIGSKPNELMSASSSIFENIIIEPAGNSTVGGSTYVMQLPGTSVIGNELACIIYLQNSIINEKYVTELKVNGEIVNGVPLNITYVEGDDDANDSFIASKYGIRLGFGINYFEFTLKVPYPLKSMNKDELNSDILGNKRNRGDEKIEQLPEETELERKERLERGRSREFIEHVKVWLQVTR